MRKKRGAALPGAIMLGSLIVFISMGIALILLETSSYNALVRTQDDVQIFFAESFNDFKDDGSLPKENEYFTWKIYEKPATDIKALTAYYKSGNGIAFYAIYDFDLDKTLAYQTGSMYITMEGGTQYLGGIVPVVD